EGKLKPRSIKNVWKVLGLILGKKRVKDWTVRLPKNPKKEQRWFTVQEMERIIDAAWGQYKYLFQLARATGMRSGELFGLRMEECTHSVMEGSQNCRRREFRETSSYGGSGT